jgi:hypothetical protein
LTLGENPDNGEETGNVEKLRTWISLNPVIESCGRWVTRMRPDHILAPNSFRKSTVKAKAFGNIWTPLASTSGAGQADRRVHPVLSSIISQGNLSGGSNINN